MFVLILGGKIQYMKINKQKTDCKHQGSKPDDLLQAGSCRSYLPVIVGLTNRPIRPHKLQFRRRIQLGREE